MEDGAPGSPGSDCGSASEGIDLEKKRHRVRSFFVSCFKEDLLQGRKMLMSQINNLYKMRTHGETLDYKALGYEKLRCFLCEIPGLEVKGFGNLMEAVLPEAGKEDFCKFCDLCQLDEDALDQNFNQPLPVPEMIQMRVIEVIRMSGMAEVPAKDFRDLWNRMYPHEKLQIKLFGYRDIRGLMANIPGVLKVRGKYILDPDTFGTKSGGRQGLSIGEVAPKSQSPSSLQSPPTSPQGKQSLAFSSQNKGQVKHSLPKAALQENPPSFQMPHMQAAQAPQVPPMQHTSQGMHGQNGHMHASRNQQGLNGHMQGLHGHGQELHFNNGYDQQRAENTRKAGMRHDQRDFQPHRQSGPRMDGRSYDMPSPPGPYIPRSNDVMYSGQPNHRNDTMHRVGLDARNSYGVRGPVAGDFARVELQGHDPCNHNVFQNGQFSHDAVDRWPQELPLQKTDMLKNGKASEQVGRFPQEYDSRHQPHHVGHPQHVGQFRSSKMTFSTTPPHLGEQPRVAYGTPVQQMPYDCPPAALTMDQRAPRIGQMQHERMQPDRMPVEQNPAQRIIPGKSVQLEQHFSKRNSTMFVSALDQPAILEQDLEDEYETLAPLPASRHVPDLDPEEEEMAAEREEEPMSIQAKHRLARKQKKQAAQGAMKEPKRMEVYLTSPAAVSSDDRDASIRQGKFDMGTLCKTQLPNHRCCMIVNFEHSRIVFTSTLCDNVFSKHAPLTQSDVVDLVHEDDRGNFASQVVYLGLCKETVLKPQQVRVNTVNGVEVCVVSGEQIVGTTWWLDFEFESGSEFALPAPSPEGQEQDQLGVTSWQ